MLHAFLTSLLKCLYNFTHLHLYIYIIPIGFFIFFFYNRTLYHMYSVSLPNLHNYCALPHCIVLNSGLHKLNTCLISVPPPWTISAVHTCRNFFPLLNKALPFHTSPSRLPFIAVLPSSAICLPFVVSHSSPLLPTPLKLLFPPFHTFF